MRVACGVVWEAYVKALATNDADDWRLYIALSDLYASKGA
jgi:hypothetical protein